MCKIAETQALIASGCVLRGLVLRDRINVGKVRDFMQQRALLAEAEQKGKRKSENQTMQHNCILTELVGYKKCILLVVLTELRYISKMLFFIGE